MSNELKNSPETRIPTEDLTSHLRTQQKLEGEERHSEDAVQDLKSNVSLDSNLTLAVTGPTLKVIVKNDIHDIAKKKTDGPIGKSGEVISPFSNIFENTYSPIGTSVATLYGWLLS